MKIKTFIKNLTKTISKKRFNLSNVVAFISELLTIVVLVLILVFMFGYRDDKKQPEYEYLIYRSMAEMHMTAMKSATVDAIDAYIDSMAPNSNLNGIAVFEMCDKYNVDVCFALAQGQIESMFGTTGVAAKTNSVWNVRAYDGRSAQDMINKGHGFDHPDKSIQPYLVLLNNRYLSDVVTEYDLMKKFVSNAGKRYASDVNYESKLQNTYNKIITKTNILDYYKEYKKYKIMLNVQ